MVATVSPVPYWSSVVFAAVVCTVVCTMARRRPGPWTAWAARAIGAALAADAVSYSIGLAVQGTWSAETSLPLALCDMGVIVATVACWWRVHVLVELTYFWGLAGTLQGLLTPDLDSAFPHLEFFEYVVGHAGIVLAALFLVVGMRIEPRAHAVARVFIITAGYSAFVGLVDYLSGANYMFLRRPPAEWTLLRLLGPWPWYLPAAAGVGLLLFTLLDAPFWRGRRHHGAGGGAAPPAGSGGDRVSVPGPAAGDGA